MVSINLHVQSANFIEAVSNRCTSASAPTTSWSLTIPSQSHPPYVTQQCALLPPLQSIRSHTWLHMILGRSTIPRNPNTSRSWEGSC